MKPEELPFPPAWMSIEIPGYRGCDGTYCFFEYNELPALDASLFTGEFQWLADLDAKHQAAQQIHQQTPADKLSKALNVLSASAAEMNLSLPPAFVKFMSSPTLRDQIPSCTACYFDLPEKIVKDPTGDHGVLIRFLNDQQDVLFWYLYLDGKGGEAVLVSPIPFDTEDLEKLSRETILNNTGFCGESFESFLYRFWLENTIWFALDENKPLTDAQERYVKQLK